MKTYKEVIHTFTSKRIELVTCDLCGDTSSSEIDWGSDEYQNINQVTIKYQHGSRYPEGDFSKTISVDICPSCFTTRVLPCLETWGAVPTETDAEG